MKKKPDPSPHLGGGEGESCHPPHPTGKRWADKQWVRSDNGSLRELSKPVHHREATKPLGLKRTSVPTGQIADTPLTSGYCPCSPFFHHHLDLYKIPEPSSSLNEGRNTPKLTPARQNRSLRKKLINIWGRTPLWARLIP